MALTQQQQFDRRQKYERVQFTRNQERELAFAQLPKKRSDGFAQLRASWLATDKLLKHHELDGDTNGALYSAALTFREVCVATADALIEAEQPKPATPPEPAKPASQKA